MSKNKITSTAAICMSMDESLVTQLNALRDLRKIGKIDQAIGVAMEGSDLYKTALKGLHGYSKRTVTFIKDLATELKTVLEDAQKNPDKVLKYLADRQNETQPFQKNFYDLHSLQVNLIRTKDSQLNTPEAQVLLSNSVKKVLGIDPEGVKMLADHKLSNDKPVDLDELLANVAKLGAYKKNFGHDAVIGTNPANISATQAARLEKESQAKLASGSQFTRDLGEEKGTERIFSNSMNM